MSTATRDVLPVRDPVREKLNKKMLAAKHPTWCPGCGDHSVLAGYFKVLEKAGVPHENIVTLAGIGCSSRFPYFVNTHGGHYLHGRSLPFAAGVSLARPDLSVFVFGGDGDGFSIGGNHLDHTARKNFNLTYVIMDNFVYGMTKNQTSPTSPLGFRSKTDPLGTIDKPINPMQRLVATGATFVARTHTSQFRHMQEIFDRAAAHEGFAVVECLSECVQFYKGAMDDAHPRRGGEFALIEEKKHDGTPEDEARHDVTDPAAAYELASREWPGVFGVFYEVKEPTKEAREGALIEEARGKVSGKSDHEILADTFATFR